MEFEPYPHYVSPSDRIRELEAEVSRLTRERDEAREALRKIATMERHSEGSFPVMAGELRAIADQYFSRQSTPEQAK